MKKLKYLFWLIIVIFLGLLVYQNLAFFTAKQRLSINLGIYEKTTPELTVGAIIAIFVGLSVLIMMFFYLLSRYETYRAKKTIKALRNSIEESSGTIATLKQEVELIKSGAPAAETPLTGNDVAGPEETTQVDTLDAESEATQTTQT